jgi:hypothetical protein
MAESLPVVSVPGDPKQEQQLPKPHIVEVVIEELQSLDDEGEDIIGTSAFAVVTSPPVSEEVITLPSSSSSEEEVEILLERVAEGPPQGGMATDAATHPVTVPSDLPIDEVPPDDHITLVEDEKKRGREEEEEVSALKKQKSEGKEVVVKEEEKVVVKEEEKVVEEEEEKVVEPKQLGPKLFTDPVELFSYFYNLLHDWNLNQNVNKYEFMVLSELVKQGNPQKVGDGIAAFQVRLHPKWQSRCYYLIHTDGSEQDFSYRKCCDALMALPKSLYRSNGELDLEKLFPGQKGRHHREQQQNGGGRGDGGGRGRGGRGGGRFGGGRGGGGRGGRRGGRGRW